MASLHNPHGALNPFDQARKRVRTGWTLILGPPGTGKTTTLLRLIDDELRTLDPWQIAFVTFTRAARVEALERASRKFDIDEGDLRWFRTIHSTAFRLLGLRKDDMMSAQDYKDFASAHGYEFSSQRNYSEGQGDGDEPNIQTEDDELLASMSWGRSRLLDVEQTLRAAPYHLEPQSYRAFVRRYDQFRRDTNKHDFHDLLELALKSDNRPPVSTAFVDEAQDLSPAQIALVEKWFADCDRVFVAGDDDQAIFKFMGAEPDWILGLRDECESVEVLEQSYRVPLRVHAMAQGLIAQNKHRVPKEYHPRGGSDGNVWRSPALWQTLEQVEKDTVFVVARNWWVLKEASVELVERGLAFIPERHPQWSPLGRPRLLAAVQASVALSEGRRASPRKLEALFDFLHSRRKATPNGLPIGTKKRAKENQAYLGLDDLRRKPWGLSTVVNAIEAHGPIEILSKVEAKTRSSLAAVLRRYKGQIPKPTIRLMSIHASKGREAHTVVVLPDMARKSYESYVEDDESEHRLAYVAATRAKENLVVIDPDTHRFYEYGPYITRANNVQVREPGEDDPNKVGW